MRMNVQEDRKLLWVPRVQQVNPGTPELSMRLHGELDCHFPTPEPFTHTHTHTGLSLTFKHTVFPLLWLGGPPSALKVNRFPAPFCASTRDTAPLLVVSRERHMGLASVVHETQKRESRLFRSES